MPILIQAIGILGAVFAFIAYQQKTHKWIMVFKTCSALCFVAQFILMKAYTGLAMNVLGIMIYLGSAYLIVKGKNVKPFVILFSVACIVLGAYTWVGAASLLAIVGETVVTIACGCKDPKYVRYVSLIGSSCWLAYDCIYFSLGGIITEVFTIISIVIAIVRFYMSQKGKKENKGEDESPR